jgi:hypothetical protein
MIVKCAATNQGSARCRYRTVITQQEFNSATALVIEKILWPGGKEPTIRFGYYRKERDNKKWRWEAKPPSILEKAKRRGFSVWQLPRDFSIQYTIIA